MSYRPHQDRAAQRSGELLAPARFGSARHGFPLLCCSVAPLFRPGRQGQTGTNRADASSDRSLAQKWLFVKIRANEDRRRSVGSGQSPDLRSPRFAGWNFLRFLPDFGPPSRTSPAGASENMRLRRSLPWECIPQSRCKQTERFIVSAGALARGSCGRERSRKAFDGRGARLLNDDLLEDDPVRTCEKPPLPVHRAPVFPLDIELQFGLPLPFQELPAFPSRRTLSGRYSELLSAASRAAGTMTKL